MGKDSDSSDVVSCSSTSSVDSPPWPFSIKGKSSDVPVPRGKAAQEINDLLGQIQDTEVSFGGLAYLLPILPGLSVTDVGTVALPLRGEMVERLKLQASEDGPQSWVIPADQVAMANPEWERGIQMLCAFSADKMGYKDIALRPRLAKVIVRGPQGSRERQLETAAGRCVATLVVQPPAEYSGGDYIVSQDGKASDARYELGVAAAAFRPHYVVYSADSSCRVERVTSGYQFALEYQLFLLSHVPWDCKKRASTLLLGKLAEAVGQLKGRPDDTDNLVDAPTSHSPEKDSSETDEDYGVLMYVLSKPYNRQDIEKNGSEALSSVDRDRFLFLKDANTLLPPGKHLTFYFASSYFSTEQKDTKEFVAWHLMTGSLLGNGTPGVLFNSLNVLNPDNKSLGQLWNNNSKSERFGCGRFAIVMWPYASDILNAMYLMGIASAIPIILKRDYLSHSTVRELLKNDMLRYYHFARAVQASKPPIRLLLLCEKLVSTIIQLDDVKLVTSFFKKYFDLLREEEKTEFLPSLAMLARKFEWRYAGRSILVAIECRLHETSLNRALTLAESLCDIPPARAALTIFAVEKAQSLCRVRPDALAFSQNMGLLWKNAIASGNTSTFLSVKNLVAQINPKHLGGIVREISKYIDATSAPEHQATLASIAWTRRQWLINEILICKKPFTWQVPDTNFPHSADILAFLQAGTRSLVISDISSMSDARFLAAIISQKIQASLSITADRLGQQAVVRITKTGGHFDSRRLEIPTYLAEIQRLGQLLPLNENTNTGNTKIPKSAIATKRPRLEEPEVINIE
ncbi:unnamed protein product [Phytophthora fragariaefolia]|uniref:Unnamed protein product n=1 Tax=Phytophthora fragariaefolia TaxID=1490495 RepID=A0A9W7CQ44_9STRA|nr:unnamed protein product [Phytophthora fragariaefolia]